MKWLDDYRKRKAEAKRAAAEETMLEKHRRDAYENVRVYVFENMAAQVPIEYSSKGLAFVDPWLYDLYEMVVMPQHRYEDVKYSQDGYRNLMYKNRPVTYKVKAEKDA